MTNPWDTQSPTIDRPEWLTPEIEQELKDRHYPIDKDGMLMLWQGVKRILDAAKEKEMEYRKICADFLVPAKTEGTTNIPLGNDFTAKVVHNYNYKLDSDNDKIWNALERIEKVGNQGKFIAERLVSWTPNFLKTEYTTLKEEADKGSIDAQAILNIIETDMLTITPAAPIVEIIKKAKKK